MAFTVTVTRQASTLDGTPGRLVTSAGFSCDCLELPWKDNQQDISCIMADTYNASLFMSPHFGHLVVRLEDKNGRANVEQHNANLAGEASGDVKQLDGCTAVGQGFGKLQNSLGNMQFAILNSVATLSNYIEHIISQVGESGTFTVTYQWQDGCAPQ